MSKFRIKMKLQGLELEIEGSREDAALIGRSLGQQMANLIQPADAILNEKPAISNSAGTLELSALPASSGSKKVKRKRNGSSAPSDADTTSAVEFAHKPEAFGSPNQGWKTAEKALWLLHVVHQVSGVEEMSTRSIVDTFNKHFKQSGTITTSNVTRDLGRLKANEKPTPLGENANKSPSVWFLTDAGIKRALVLVNEATGKVE